MARFDNRNADRAREILRGAAADAAEMYDLAMRLKKENRFGLARKLLGRIKAADVPDLNDLIKRRQQYALCTYKDPDLAVDFRLDRALEILKETDDPQRSTNQETLALAGAIYKRKWEVDAQKQHLERSLAYYHRGYQLGVEKDCGYTGINAAFVLDLLAREEESLAREAGTVSQLAKARRAEARSIRENVISALTASPQSERANACENLWWFHTTIAEAYFGLRDYWNALPHLEEAAKIKDVSPWEQESTVRQLAQMARLHGDEPSPGLAYGGTDCQQVLRKLLEALGDETDAALRSAFYGKVGLALSGGGFRASLFHIGVLAKLAELDVLRRVEVLSCVSGGSIIGAHYYLEVRNLLQTKPDGQITPQDYIDIVKRIEREFLSGVQRNIRTRVAADVKTNFKMVFSPNYSRTVRAGELYESELYSRVADGNGGKPRYMSDLLVQPIDGPEEFKPKYDNWHRDAKVPELVLNATPLNTGHNWQFTASFMGEPPADIDSEVDGNYRLRRLYYDDAPGDYKKKKRVRVGAAVGASACVPGLFEPIALPVLYGQVGEQKKEITVRLVDGGVHDNQGVASLLEQGCTQIIVSDASGQINTIDDPDSGLLAVPMRSNSTLMARVRESQFRELAARRRAALLQGLVFIHLKKDLEVDPVDWVQCNDRYNPADAGRPARDQGDLTSYNVRKDVQRQVAAIRTDLDSFSEAEAYALMMSGYAMIERDFKDCMKDLAAAAPRKEDWKFLAVEKAMKGGDGYNELIRRLGVSHMRGFKVWKLLKWLRVASVLFGLAVVAGLVWVCLRWWDRPLPDAVTKITLGLALGLLFAMVVAAVLLRVIGPPIQRFLHWRKTPSEFGIGLALLILTPLAWLHLMVFDRLFLQNGRIEKITGTKPDVGKGATRAAP